MNKAGQEELYPLITLISQRRKRRKVKMDTQPLNSPLHSQSELYGEGVYPPKLLAKVDADRRGVDLILLSFAVQQVTGSGGRFADGVRS